MNSNPNKKEKEHQGRVKELPCSVCGAPPPSAAHHIDQSCAWTVIALCHECHQGRGGIHHEKTMWRIYKMDEVKALNITLKRLLS